MPTKQEIIGMMENHLPGEPISIGSSTRQPPAYPTLEGALTGEQMQPLQYGDHDERVYAITAAPISKKLIEIKTLCSDPQTCHIGRNMGLSVKFWFMILKMYKKTNF